MSIRALFTTVLPAIVVMCVGTELYGADLLPILVSQPATASQWEQTRRLPNTKLSALGAAVHVARIQNAFPATNQEARVISRSKSAVGNGTVRGRPAAVPSVAARAMVAAAEPRGEAPKATVVQVPAPRFDSQVVAASYSSPVQPSQQLTAGQSTMPNSDNPLRDSAGAHSYSSRTTYERAATQSSGNPLR